MNNGQRLIAALLAVVAVLLAVNIVQGPRAAEAQEIGDGEPYVVKWLTGSNTYWRVWSDGQIDQWADNGEQDCQYEFEGVVLGPSGHSADVSDANGGGSSYIIMYADGRVDQYWQGEVCTIAGDGSAPFCLGDVDRNGETNFTDLLFVLNDWGECE